MAFSRFCALFFSFACLSLAINVSFSEGSARLSGVKTVVNISFPNGVPQFRFWRNGAPSVQYIFAPTNVSEVAINETRGFRSDDNVTAQLNVSAFQWSYEVRRDTTFASVLVYGRLPNATNTSLVSSLSFVHQFMDNASYWNFTLVLGNVSFSRPNSSIAVGYLFSLEVNGTVSSNSSSGKLVNESVVALNRAYFMASNNTSVSPKTTVTFPSPLLPPGMGCPSPASEFITFICASVGSRYFLSCAPNSTAVVQCPTGTICTADSPTQNVPCSASPFTSAFGPFVEFWQTLGAAPVEGQKDVDAFLTAEPGNNATLVHDTFAFFPNGSLTVAGNQLGFLNAQ